jgi:hypothetical protein
MRIRPPTTRLGLAARSEPGFRWGFSGSAGAVLFEQVIDGMEQIPFLGFVRAKTTSRSELERAGSCKNEPG